MCILAGKVRYYFTLASQAGNKRFACAHKGAQYALKTLPGVNFGFLLVEFDSHCMALILYRVMRTRLNASDTAALARAPWRNCVGFSLTASL